MANTPSTLRVEYDVEVQIKEHGTGRVIASSTSRLGTDVRITCYSPAERTAREAVTAARKELGHFSRD